jgi:hypothetical protein
MPKQIYNLSFLTGSLPGGEILVTRDLFMPS